MQREGINRLVHLDVSRQRIVPALYPDQRAGLFRALELLQGLVQLFSLELAFSYLVIGSGGVVGVIVTVDGQAYGMNDSLFCTPYPRSFQSDSAFPMSTQGKVTG